MNRTEDMLTILMPIKGRLEFTKRWITWANQEKIPFKIIFADGSENNELSEYLHSYKNLVLNYDYNRFPFDSDYMQYYKKIADALEKVKTEYVVLHDNDDFFFPPCFFKAVEFLEQNKTFSACGGELYSMYLVPKSENSSNFVYGQKVDYYKTIVDPTYGEKELPMERIQSMFHSYFPGFYYYVRRTSQLRDTFKAICENKFYDLYLAELFVSSAVLAEGKVKTLALPYYFRQANVTGSSAKEGAKEGGYLWRMLQKNFSNDLNALGENLYRILKEKHGEVTDQEVFCKEIRRLYYDYIKYVIVNEVVPKKPALKERIMQGIKECFGIFSYNGFLRIGLRKLYPYFNKNGQYSSLDQYGIEVMEWRERLETVLFKKEDLDKK